MISALLIKDNIKDWTKKYKLSMILGGYAIIFILPSIFNKDIFGLGNGNNIITSFLLTALGIIFSNEKLYKFKLHITWKIATLMSMSVILNIILVFSMLFISLRIHGYFSTAYRFNVLTSISVVAMSIVIFIVGQKLKINIKVLELKCLTIVSDFLNSYGNLPTFENQEQGAQQNGALQQFLNNIDVTIMKKETNYSKKKVDKLARKYSKLANKINTTRNNDLSTQTVIFNLSESLANPNRLKEVELSQNPLSYIDSIRKKTTSGLMISSGLGGGTANMEYMTLTGLPVSNFSPTIATPYTQVVPESEQTMTINEYFKKSTAIHPYNGSFYSRKAVYQKFGFQRFMYFGSKYKIKHKIKVGTNPYLSDETAYQNTLDVIKSYKSGQFINLVTMQNHLPYSDYYDNSEGYQVSGDIDDGEKNTISNYSAGLSYTDKAVEKFIEQIDKINKPITLVFYGDHLPGIYSNIDGNSLEARETDYFIYSNKYAKQHGAKNLRHVKYVLPIDFVALTAEQTNSKVSPYYALLTEIQKELPTIKVYAYNDGKNPVFVDKKGKTVKYKQLTKKQKSLYDDLKLVQYDLTAGNQYLYKTKFFNVR